MTGYRYRVRVLLEFNDTVAELTTDWRNDPNVVGDMLDEWQGRGIHAEVESQPLHGTVDRDEIPPVEGNDAQ